MPETTENADASGRLAAAGSTARGQGANVTIQFICPTAWPTLYKGTEDECYYRLAVGGNAVPRVGEHVWFGGGEVDGVPLEPLYRVVGVMHSMYPWEPGEHNPWSHVLVEVERIQSPSDWAAR